MARFTGRKNGQRGQPRPRELHVTLTPFYALDQEHLRREYWELADLFAELHALATGRTTGLARITVADLLLALDAWNHIEERPELLRHRVAVARIGQALGDASHAAH
jgi:hypothetical protein